MSFSFFPHLHLVHLSLFTSTTTPFHKLGKLPLILKTIAYFISSEALSPFPRSQEEIVILPTGAHQQMLVEAYQRQRSCLLSSCSEFYTQSLTVSDGAYQMRVCGPGLLPLCLFSSCSSDFGLGIMCWGLRSQGDCSVFPLIPTPALLM